jgi:cellulose synthase/poly-beta-1,6-N-acetylglucosamine synthase-like glycosyltransferase
VSFLEISIFAVYVAILVLLAIYGVHRYVLAGRYLRARHRLTHPRSPAWLPPVTVQLPIFNERHVAERLIESVCALDYPRELLEIQVLDDSDDETVEICAAAVARKSALGHRVLHLRRGSREGYKAGALAYGLERAKGGLVAVFDADFVPASDFLTQVVAEFEEPSVGMVQARWGHLNRDYSAFTRVQALMLDGHFLIEHSARAATDCFFNFNGTAGVWRRRCIETSGGWQADTLTEDLDLSYRAQLAGWRFVYLPEVVVQGEVPVDLNSFKSQQRRWAKGALQTARKLFPEILRSRLPARVKCEAFFHLTASMSYLLLTLLTLLFPLTMVIRHEHGDWAALYGEIPVLVLSTASVCAFYLIAQRRVGRRRPTQILFLMAVGVGVALSNAAALVEALFGRRSPFQRTPKFGVVHRGDGWRQSSYRVPVGWVGIAEIGCALYFALALAYAIAHGIWMAIPFLLLFLSGYAYVGVLSLSQGARLTSFSGREATKRRRQLPPPPRHRERSERASRAPTRSARRRRRSRR